MKDIKRLFTALLVVSATSLYAVRVEVTPTVAKAFKTGDDSMKDDRPLYGVRGTVFLNDEVGVQASFEGSTNNELVGQNGAKTDLERVSANIVYEKNTGTKIRPYMVVGVGNESTHGSVAPTTGDGSQGFIQAGGGVKFGINNHIDLLTEAKWIKKLSNDDDDIVATVGVGLNTGNSPKINHIPSVTETSEAQNAINLAEFKKIMAQKKAAKSMKKATVVASAAKEVISPVASTAVSASSTVLSSSTDTAQTDIDGNPIPSDAVVLGDSTSQSSSVVTSEVDNSSLTTVESSDLNLEGDVVYDDASSSVSTNTASDSYSDAKIGYYVQMAALFEGNGDAITKRLEEKNYPYILHNVTKGSREATLILVGPYSSRTEAGVALKYLRRLKHDAFIYHLD